MLTNVSAHFGRGQITGLVGRNGSGKSVLLKIVVGLMSAYAAMFGFDKFKEAIEGWKQKS